MQRVPFLGGLVLVLCLGLSQAQAKGVERTLPVPQTVSPQLQALIAKPAPAWWSVQPKTAQEWKDLVEPIAQATEKILPALRERLGVTSTQEVLGGVPVFRIAPKMVPVVNQDKILLHLHGGGYVLNPGESGTLEALYMAGYSGLPIISVDYRMPPEHPYPAAMDDALAVYKELLKSYPAAKIGVFGTSTGGGMTLALVLRAKAEGLPVPGAIAPGTPWSDLTETGDSYFINKGVDTSLVAYDGWLKAAALVYANGHDLKDPFLSPVYGDMHGFPPTLLTSGTRDLFLSNTVRVHLKLREAGVPADLIVFEGMSHAHYYMAPEAPETALHFSELAKFFAKYLDSNRNGF